MRERQRGRSSRTGTSSLSVVRGRDRSRFWVARAWPVLMLAVLLLTSLAPQPVLADGGRAGLVIQFADGDVWKGCVDLGGDSLTGAEVLQRSGFRVLADYGFGLGTAVCKIDGDGCDFPSQECFCQCQGVECRYWAYYHLGPDNTWQYSQMGASGYQVRAGAVEGWSWGPGVYGSSGVVPPVFTFEQICASPTPTAVPATNTPTATVVPTATPTATPWPTVTPTTVLLTATPTATNALQAGDLRISLEAQAKTIARGECTTLRWDVTGAEAIYWYDGTEERGVTGQEERQVCPPTSQAYTLRVQHAGGEELRQISIAVVQATNTPQPSGAPVTSEESAGRPDKQAVAVPPATPSPASMVAAASAATPPTPLPTPDTLPRPTVPAVAAEGVAANSLATVTPRPDLGATPLDPGAETAPSTSVEEAALPTPGPQALALARPAEDQTRSESDGQRQVQAASTAPNTARGSVDEALLLRYGAFAFLAALLCLAATFVLRRRVA